MESGKRIIGYARVSTREQVEGFSLDYQKRQIYLKCEQLGENIKSDNIFIEEGASAKNLKRPQMRQIIKLIENEEVDVIIIYKLDRLSRSLKDLLVFVEMCLDRNISLISIKENFDMTTAMGRMMAYIMAVLAQFEREQISERTIMGYIEKAEQGFYPFGNKVPFGYYKDEEHKLFVNQEEIEIVKEMLQLYAYENQSEYFVLEHIKNKYNKNRITVSNLKVFLNNTIHQGIVHVAGTIYNIVDPIFTEKDKEMLERRRTLNAYTKQPYKYLNKVFINGELAKHETTRKKTKDYTYYVIRGVGRVSEKALVKEVLCMANEKVSAEEMKTKYRCEKLAKALIDNQITKKQFNDLYTKEEKKLKKLATRVKRIDVEIIQKQIIDIKVELYK